MSTLRSKNDVKAVVVSWDLQRNLGREALPTGEIPRRGRLCDMRSKVDVCWIARHPVLLIGAQLPCVHAW